MPKISLGLREPTKKYYAEGEVLPRRDSCIFYLKGERHGDGKEVCCIQKKIAALIRAAILVKPPNNLL
jgi:hypothetical protein